MIQNDIDLLEQESKDSYYFALRLINLTKNRKKSLKHLKNSHFKFVLQQNNYVIAQTHNTIQNIFWMINTTMISLNKQSLSFSLTDITQTNTQFQLKLYIISHLQVTQLASMSIQALTYVEIFLQCNKTLFKQTVSLGPLYTLEYEVYIQRSQIELLNLVKCSDQQCVGLKNAFRKKLHQVIQVQNQRVEVKLKGREFQENNLLRKSLYVNMSKLMEVKKRNQQIKDKSLSKNNSRSSFFTQIGDIFRPKPSINTHEPIFPARLGLFSQNSSIKQCKTNKQKQKTDSDKSYSIHPPWVSNSQYSRWQNGLEQDSLKILREKQRLRVKAYTNAINKGTETKEQTWKVYSRVFKVIMLILLLTFVVYYLSSGGKKGKYRFFKSMDWLGLGS